MHMAHPAKPNAVYHADWGSTAKKRWCARATLGTAGRRALIRSHLTCSIALTGLRLRLLGGQ
jgi:hypothetical protein